MSAGLTKINKRVNVKLARMNKSHERVSECEIDKGK